MIRRISLLAAAVLVLTSCSGRLGSTVPECDVALTTGIVIQVQAVPSATLVPCIESLPTGWDYNHLDPRSGSAEFSIDSDRMGIPFLRVRTSASCDAEGGTKGTSLHAGAELYRRVTADTTVRLAFIAEGSSEETIAAVERVLIDLVGRTFNGRRPEVTFDRSEGPVSQKIQAARDRGAHVLVVGLREAEQGTVSLLLADGSRERIEPVAKALHILDEVTPEPTYRGSWYYVFEGGCTEYRFDAVGPDTLSISHDADDSLGFVPTGAVKDVARDAGFRVP